MEIGQQLHDHFNGERDEQNFNSLTREVAACRPYYPDVSVSRYFGNFEDHMGGILRKIPPGAASSRASVHQCPCPASGV